MIAVFKSLALLAVAQGVLSLPVGLKMRAVTRLSPSQLSAFAPYAQFARATYCSTALLKTWNCGHACSALPGFQPTLVGGDGNGIQMFFVGYWPTQNAVVVAHEGTDPSQLLSDLTDINFFRGPLSPSLFPGVSPKVEVHEGFRDEHTITAPSILAEVEQLMLVENTQSVIVIGHSLGGALAELDSLFLTLNLPSGTSVKAVTYGTPRVGNPAFASLIDQHVPDFQRVDNKKDIIPIVPGEFLGFKHPHGEVHILAHGKAVYCPGDDDAKDPQCQIKSVPNIFEGDLLDHLGPYDGIMIGTVYCT